MSATPSAPTASLVATDNRPMLAIGLMLVASVSYALMGAGVKWAGQLGEGLWSIVGARSVFLAVAILVMMRVRGLSWRPGAPWKLAARSVIGFVAMCCYFYALTRVPLANAVTIQWTSPLFVALFGAAMLGERVTRTTLVCSVAALCGVVMILHPDPQAFDTNALFAVVSAVLAGLSYVFVRQLKDTDPPERIVGWFSVFALVATVPFLIASDPGWPTATAWLALGLAGVGAFGGQIFLTWAYRFGEAAFVSAFSYTTVLFSAVVGYASFGESPTLLEGAGAVLVVAAGVVLSWRTRRRMVAAAAARAESR